MDGWTKGEEKGIIEERPIGGGLEEQSFGIDGWKLENAGPKER